MAGDATAKAGDATKTDTTKTDGAAKTHTTAKIDTTTKADDATKTDATTKADTSIGTDTTTVTKAHGSTQPAAEMTSDSATTVSPLSKETKEKQDGEVSALSELDKELAHMFEELKSTHI